MKKLFFLFSFFVFWQEAVFSTSSFVKRADFIISYVADKYPRFNDGQRPPGASGDLSDFGKYNYPKIIALYEKYGTASPKVAIAHERLDKYQYLPTFHFNLVGLPRIMYKFPRAKGVLGNEKEFLKRVFERTDSYNAWTGEGTENHVSMNRTSGYLYAQLAMELFPGEFPGAPQRIQQMKEWILYFSKQLYQTGNGEFNSATYGAYNIIGWLNVYDFAKDEEVKKAARAALDYYACELALHNVQGMNGGADMRGKGCTRAFEGATYYFSWLWFGTGSAPVALDNIPWEDQGNNEIIQSIHPATSTYYPPPLAVKLATGQFQVPAMYYNSKGDYLMGHPSWIKQTYYKDREFSLGAGYIPYGGWSSGDYQIVSWKFISQVDRQDAGSPQYLSGLGTIPATNKYYQSGNHRAPFDQLVHHENVMIQLTRMPLDAEDIKKSIKPKYKEWEERWARDFYQRFPGDPDKNNPVHFQDFGLSVNRSSLVLAEQGDRKISWEPPVLFVALEKTFLAIQSVRQDKIERHEAKNGKMVFEVNAPLGKICGFVIEAVNRDDYANLDEFKENIRKAGKVNNQQLDTGNQLEYVSSRGHQISCAYQVSGEFQEPIYDWGYGPVEPGVIAKSPPYRQPGWPSGKGHGKIAKWWVNGQEINVNGLWPVYHGPGLYIGEGILLLKEQKTCYLVDYTKKVPRFSMECQNPEKPEIWK